MACIDFWSSDRNPVTMFKPQIKNMIKRPNNLAKSLPFTSVKDFVHDDYIESKEVAEDLNIGTVMLCRLMSDLGYERVSYSGKKYYTLEAIDELKKSDLLAVNPKSKLDRTWMITSVELAEQYDVPAWKRHKIVEASGLKPVFRHSGQVYFDKEKIIPFFEKYKSGTLKFKPRKK